MVSVMKISTYEGSCLLSRNKLDWEYLNKQEFGVQIQSHRIWRIKKNKAELSRTPKKKRTERLQKIKLLEFIFPSLDKSDYCKKIKTTFSILELSEVNLYYQNTADACFLQPRSAYIFNSFKHQIILKDGQRFNLQHWLRMLCSTKHIYGLGLLTF